MLFSAITIICIMAFYVIINSRNKFIYVMAIYFCSIAVMMVVAVLYISKLSTYKFPMKIDYSIYLFLSKTRIHTDDLARMYNIGIALFMFATVVFIRVLKKYTWWKIILILLPILYFLIWNDSDTSWKLFLWLNSTSDPETINNLNRLINVNKVISELTIAIYMLLPFYLLFTYFFHTRIKIKRTNALVFGVCLFLINCFVYAFFIQGSFSNIMFNNVDLAKFPTNTMQNIRYIVAPIMIMFVLIVVILLTLYFKPFNSLILMSKKEMIQNTRLLNKNLGMVLHTYKNAFLGIGKLVAIAEENINNGNNQAAIECTQKSSEIVINNLLIIDKTLGMLKDINVKYIGVNLVKCIDNALEKSCLPTDILVRKDYEINDILILGDEYHLVEVFVNLFVNAAEALKKKNGKEPFIKIVNMMEDDFCIVQISDNGCGIDKKELRNIFKPFYSTKPRTTGGGIGLNYAENVIKRHHGDITVKSEIGKYTNFQIVLPIYKKSRQEEKNEKN